MSYTKGQVVQKDTFLNDSAFAKEQYEGLLVASDPQSNSYQIGIQVSENQVLVVDHASENNVRERIQNWAAQIQDIQQKYGQSDDLDEYRMQ